MLFFQEVSLPSSATFSFICITYKDPILLLGTLCLIFEAINASFPGVVPPRDTLSPNVIGIVHKDLGPWLVLGILCQIQLIFVALFVEDVAFTSSVFTQAWVEYPVTRM
jgi:hypothetical protein